MFSVYNRNIYFIVFLRNLSLFYVDDNSACDSIVCNVHGIRLVHDTSFLSCSVITTSSSVTITTASSFDVIHCIITLNLNGTDQD